MPQSLQNESKGLEPSSATHPGSPGGHSGKTCPDVTCSDRTSALLRGLCVVLQEHKAKPELIEQFKQQVRDFLDDSPDELVWVKRTKYLLNLQLAKYLKCEAPGAVDKPLVFKGSVRKWIRNRLNSFSIRNTHLWYSWFQCKRATLVCSEKFIQNVYDEHLNKLQSPDPGDPFAIDAAFSNPVFFELLTLIRERIEYKMLKTKEFRWLDISNNMPSSSACFNGTRLSGGQFYQLKMISRFGARIGSPHLFEVENENDESEFYLDFLNVSWTSELYKMEWFPVIIGSHIQHVEVREPTGFDDWITLLQRFQSMNPDSPLGAQIQGVIEPLKVRVISKGESVPYYFHRALQKALHGVMRKIPCFRLIGRPFCPTDALDLKEISKDFYEWFSVDYSAATDGLSWRFSSMILRFLMKNFPEKDLQWALRVLGPHQLHYPIPGGKGYEYKGDQVNGQLMGSILSFPILCLANIATYLLTMSDVQEGWSLEKRLSGVLVNGDDMVYAAPPEKWARHVKISGDLGLSMSIGKAYHHPVYLNINSTSVHLDLSRSDVSPKQVDYLNTGLLLGSDVQKKKGLDSRESEAGPSGFVSSINPLLSGCFSSRSQRSILGLYLGLHKAPIQLESTVKYLTQRGSGFHTRNLFLPCSMGGMGVNPPIGWRFKIKKFDQVVAASFQKEGVEYSYGRPVRHPEIKEICLVRPVAWQKPKADGEMEIQIDLLKKMDRSLLRSEMIPISENTNRYYLG